MHIRKGAKSNLGITAKSNKLENQLKVTHAYLPTRMRCKVDKFIGKIDNDMSKNKFIQQNRYNDCPSPTLIKKPNAEEISPARILSRTTSPKNNIDQEDETPRNSKAGMTKEKKESI